MGVERPLFPWLLGVSASIHVFIAMLFWNEQIELPQAIPPQLGKASLQLRVSAAIRPKPAEVLFDKSLAELQPLPKTAEPKDAVTKLPRTSEEAVARPQLTEQAFLPRLTADSRSPTPPELPDLPELDALLPPLKTVTLELVVPPLKTSNDVPQALPRPAPKELLPKLEAVTKIAEVVAVASAASDASQGVAPDELPRKLPVNPSPPYPTDALAAQREGVVVLRVRIDAAGKVAAISVETSSGMTSMDESALTTVRNWVFSPARRSGRAIPFEVLQPIDFFIRRRN